MMVYTPSGTLPEVLIHIFKLSGNEVSESFPSNLNMTEPCAGTGETSAVNLTEELYAFTDGTET